MERVAKAPRRAALAEAAPASPAKTSTALAGVVAPAPTKKRVQQLAAAEAAGVTVLTFDDLPQGTSITTQYASQGVVFGSPNTTQSPFITGDGSNPTSPVLSGYPTFRGDIVGWFVIPGTGTSTTVSSISLDVGYIDSPGSIQVVAYTTGGADIISATQTGINTITSSVGNIFAFEVLQSADEPAGFAIDNVMFTPGSNPTPGLAGGKPKPSESYGGTNPGSTLTVCGIRLCGDPVNTLTGNLTETFTDIDVNEVGPGLDLDRTYNSLDADHQGWFGHGWRSTWEDSVTITDPPPPAGGEEPGTRTATVTFANGSTVAFSETPLGWIAAPRVTAKLDTFSDGTSTVTLVGGTTYSFDAGGLLASTRDPNGVTTTVERPDANTVIVRDNWGYGLTLALTGGKVISSTDPAGHATTYAYTGDDLTSVTTPGGATTTFGYNASHQLTSQTGPTGAHSVNTYSGGKVATQNDTRGGDWAYTYTGDGDPTNVTTVTEPDGTITEHRYDNGLLTKATSAKGTSLEAVWTYTYDAITGGRTSDTLPDGTMTTREFDARGNIIKQTDAEGRATTYTYDDFGNRTTTTYPSGRLDVAEFDSAGNLSYYTEDWDNLALTTAYYRDSEGKLTEMVSPSGAYTTFENTETGLPQLLTDPDSRQLAFTYDELGRELTRTQIAADDGDPNTNDQTTSRTWDVDGNLTVITDPNGDTSTYTYDNAGNQLTATTPQGATTTNVYSAAGDLTSTTTAGATTTFEYNAFGNSTKRIDPGNKVTSYGYDKLRRRNSETDPLGRTSIRTFDAASRVHISKDADGSQVTYSYDNSGLVTGIDYSDTTPDVTYTYNDDAQRATMTDGTGETEYSYDTAGRVTGYHSTSGSSVALELDRDDQPISTTYPGGDTVTKSYTAGGRLQSITDGDGNTTRFGTNTFGQTNSVDYANGISSTWTYDATGQPTNVTYNNPDDSPLMSFTAEVGTGGLVDSTSGGLNSTTTNYQYNDRNQLSKVDSNAVTFDSNANMLTRPDGFNQTFDKADQLTAATPARATAATLSVKAAKKATASNKSLTLGKITVLSGQKLWIVSSSGRAKASRAVGASKPSGPGLTFKLFGSKAGKAGRSAVWFAAPSSTKSATVTLMLGKGHGAVQASAVLTTGGSTPNFVSGTGANSAATLKVATSAKDVVINTTGLLAKRAPTFQVAAGSKKLGTARDAARKFAAGSTRSGPTTTAGTVGTGAKNKATAWVGAAVRIPAAPAATAFTYSSAGERTKEGTTGYSYDAEHRLTKVTDGATTSTYTYNGDGLRVGEDVGGTSKSYTYDISDTAADLLTAGDTEYIYGPGNLPIAQVEGSTVTYLLSDTQGNVRALTNADGAVAGIQEFSATGVRTVAGTVKTALGFHGQYTDATGLQYLRARYYDPLTAAFLTRDPLTRLTGSAYGYGGGNPISFADPTGLVFVSCSDIIGGVNQLSNVGDAAIASLTKGMQLRATLLGRALRTSPSAAVRSYAASELRAAGTALRSPVMGALSKVSKGLPLLGAGLTYGVHLLDGDSQQQAIGAGAGAGVGGALGGSAGAAAGGALCGAAAAGTFGLGAATCPLLIGGGALVGGVAGGWIGENVGGWVGGWFD